MKISVDFFENVKIFVKLYRVRSGLSRMFFKFYKFRKTEK